MSLPLWRGATALPCAPSGRRHQGRTRPGRSRSAGQAFVELGLVIPVMLFLLLGALDLGRVYYSNIAVANAAKEAALLASNGGSSPSDAAVEEARGGFVTVTAANVTTTYSDATNKCSAGASLGASVTVSVRAPFKAITPYVGALIGGQSVMLGSTVTAQCAVFPGADLGPPDDTTCTVPDLVGQSEGSADVAWQGAWFTGSVTRVGSGTGWTIASQSPAGDTTALCTSGLTIYKAAPTNCTIPSIGKNWYFSNYSLAWAGVGFKGTLTDNTGGHKVKSVSPAVGSSQPCTVSGTVS